MGYPLNLKHALPPDIPAACARRLIYEVMAAPNVKANGVYCIDTRCVIIVAVHAGQILRWTVVSPVGEDEAAGMLRMAGIELVTKFHDAPAGKQ